MNEQWRQEWESFRRSPPGRRFRDRYERARALPRPRHHRIARWVCGVATILVGIVLIPLPGPGWLIVGFGVTMLAQESMRIARSCDRLEYRAQAWIARWRAWRAKGREAPPS